MGAAPDDQTWQETPAQEAQNVANTAGSIPSLEPAPEPSDGLPFTAGNHHTMTTESVAQDQLRAFIERIERMEEEKKAITDDIKEIYAEAKGSGFDIRKQDRSEWLEQEAILDLYMAALGMQYAPPESEE